MHGLDVRDGQVRRSSSRFCFGVEHGDYNGTELFGIGTNRFIWLAYKPNGTNRVRLFSANVPAEGIVDFALDAIPASVQGYEDSWARFPLGVASILRQEGLPFRLGFDGVLYGNIPGGGMSRSASLTLNLIVTLLAVNDIELATVERDEPLKIVELAQAVENDFIGSPCGNLDQIMIYFARAGMGTHFRPSDRSLEHIPIGPGAADFRIVCLDTGTDRPGLDKSTYKIRRAECDELVELAREEFGIRCLADVRTSEQLSVIKARFQSSHPQLINRLDYIYNAQQRFYKMLDAWKAGNIEEVGAIFRTDGLGLRDDYQISGPELECMCDIARTVPGVLGERMLGGGDKGASGAIVVATAVDALRAAVATQYPQHYPELAEKFAVHVCQSADGIVDCQGL